MVVHLGTRARKPHCTSPDIPLLTHPLSLPLSAASWGQPRAGSTRPGTSLSSAPSATGLFVSRVSCKPGRTPMPALANVHDAGMWTCPHASPAGRPPPCSYGWTADEVFSRLNDEEFAQVGQLHCRCDGSGPRQCWPCLQGSAASACVVCDMRRQHMPGCGTDAPDPPAPLRIFKIQDALFQRRMLPYTHQLFNRPPTCRAAACRAFPWRARRVGPTPTSPPSCLPDGSPSATSRWHSCGWCSQVG